MFKLQDNRFDDMNNPKKAPIEDLKEVKNMKEGKKKKLPKEDEMFDKNYKPGGTITMGKKIKKPKKDDFFVIRKSCVSRTCKNGIKQ